MLRWVGGDWTTKYAPTGKGPEGPRGVTPPGAMFVLSADNFYYGGFYMLPQVSLNLDAHGEHSLHETHTSRKKESHLSIYSRQTLVLELD
eukprot:54539-Amphidinium_carterae.1